MISLFGPGIHEYIIREIEIGTRAARFEEYERDGMGAIFALLYQQDILYERDTVTPGDFYGHPKIVPPSTLPVEYDNKLPLPTDTDHSEFHLTPPTSKHHKAMGKTGRIRGHPESASRNVDKDAEPSRMAGHWRGTRKPTLDL